MHFMVLAWDGTDDGAVERRKAARPAHGEYIGKLHADGTVVLGAGLLDDEGVIRGSLVITSHATRADVDTYIDGEPLNTGGAWERVEVHPVWIPDHYLPPRPPAAE